MTSQFVIWSHLCVPLSTSLSRMSVWPIKGNSCTIGRIVVCLEPRRSWRQSRWLPSHRIHLVSCHFRYAAIRALIDSQWLSGVCLILQFPFNLSLSHLSRMPYRVPTTNCFHFSFPFVFHIPDQFHFLISAIWLNWLLFCFGIYQSTLIPNKYDFLLFSRSCQVAALVAVVCQYFVHVRFSFLFDQLNTLIRL